MTSHETTGRPEVVFIHGAWHGSWIWASWLPLFSERGYEPTAFGLRGHGAGEQRYLGVRLMDHVADVARELDRRRTPPIMVGHSLGGRIIQHLMANRRFPAVVLLAPIPGRYPARVILANALRHPAAMTKVNLQGDLYPMVATRKLVREVLFTPETPEDIVSRCHRRLIGACPRLFREMASSRPPAPIAGTPTLLLAPGEDKSFTVKMQRRVAAKIRSPRDRRVRARPAIGYAVAPGCRAQPGVAKATRATDT